MRLPSWLLNFLKTGPAAPPPIFTGALPDDRPASAQAEDINLNDIVAKVAPVSWAVLDITKLPTWPVMNQGSTSACVAFSKSLMTSILYFLRTGVFVQMSPKWVYGFRKNKPQEGMVGYDAFDIEASKGVVPEAMEVSEGLTEAQLNAYAAQPWELQVGLALRVSDQRIVLPSGDLETLASVQQITGKPVMVWYRWFYDEWTRNAPTVLRGAPPYTHSVAFVPPRLPGQNSIGLYNGKKAIVIQDSWGLNDAEGTLAGMRIITEDFHAARNIFAAYSMRFKFDEAQGSKPEYDGTIISVQKCLQYEGCFPMNVAFVENLGPVSKKSLAQFQLKYSLPITSALDDITITKLKALYP